MGPKKVLFITNAEHGNSQVSLSVIHELLKSDIEVHVASFSPLKARIEQLQAVTSTLLGKPHVRIHFHELESAHCFLDALSKCHVRISNLAHKPGLVGARHAFESIPHLLSPWTPSDYVELWREVLHVIEVLEPNYLVVDNLFTPGLDAARSWGGKFSTINPMGFNGSIMNLQPKGALFWKYPIVCSGFAFPLPWSDMLRNVYLQVSAIWVIVMSPKNSALQKARQSAGMKGPHPGFTPWVKQEHYIQPTVREIDFPVEWLPENVIACGPITLPYQPLRDCEPALMIWLGQVGRRTILINLGSHLTTQGDDAAELACALASILDCHRDLQVLWKNRSEDRSTLDKTLQVHLKSDRVRITSWLESDPIAILHSGHIALMIHHGGANSFFETIEAGVPAVVLPGWYDCYQYAALAEYLGTGIWASKTSAPHNSAAEIQPAIEKALGDEYRSRARDIGDVARKGGGRETAAKAILERIKDT